MSPADLSPRPPASSRPISARDLALRTLADLREGRRTARATIDDLLEPASLPPPEIALATELVMGVVRHRLTLAKVLGAYAVHGWQRVNRQIQHVLMLGAYQLIWLDGIPPFAAVHEAVNQARAIGGQRAARFVNALLRQLLRDVEHPRLAENRADPRRAIPVGGGQYLQLRRPVFADPAVNPVAWLAEISSHPTWLVGRWLHHFGRPAAETICRYGMSRPVTFLRPNHLRTDAVSLAARLNQEGFSAEPTPAGQVVVAGASAGLVRSPVFREGLFQPQDPTAMKPVESMKLSPGQVVIDLCAGLGTKTGQIAEAMNNQGLVLASDTHAGRLDRLMANCRRLGLTIVRALPSESLERAAAELHRLDWILVDAPCSNTGVLARRPEARYRADPKTLASLAGVQAALLDRAAALARPETRLLYATCSLEPEENEHAAAGFARRHPEWMLVGSELTLPAADGPPSRWRDGGYLSIWKR